MIFISVAVFHLWSIEVKIYRTKLVNFLHSLQLLVSCWRKDGILKFSD